MYETFFSWLLPDCRNSRDCSNRDTAAEPDPMTSEPEPLVPEKCEQIDTWNGLKIWAGDCISASPPETAAAVSGKKTTEEKAKNKIPGRRRAKSPVKRV